jgi:2-phospho-L-lactate/phosphoenolpyruvate guanylyltransferase
VSCWALVPIKERAACKTRLDTVLSPDPRYRLVCALLEHVLDTLRDSPGVNHIALVSPERDSVSTDIELLDHSRSGLNEDVSRALIEAARRGAHQVLIVPADLPLLTVPDVQALLACGSPVALAPDRHERGTNALAVPAQWRSELGFGSNSFARHLLASRSVGIEPAVVRRPGIAFDIDEVEDLRLLRHHPLWAELTRDLQLA